MRTIALLAGFAAALALAVACGRGPQCETVEPHTERGGAAGGAAGGRTGESARLHDIFARGWAFALQADPVFATRVGVHDHDDRLPSRAPAALERQHQVRQGLLEELDRIDVTRLDESDRVSHAIYRAQLEDEIAKYELGAYQMPISAEGGFHSEFARLPIQTRFETVRDYESYLARLRQWPRLVEEQIALMRIGLERGMTPPRVVLQGIEQTMDAHVVADPTASVFYGPLADLPARVPAEDRDRLQAEAKEVIAEAVVPGFRELRRFVVEEYIPGARTSIGASALPNGRAYYAQRVRHFTTLDKGAEEIHQIGLREVERIHAEMLQVIEQVGFEGSFAEFVELLRTDPRFYASSPEQLLEKAAFIAKRMDGKLLALFERLPRRPYTVEPVPAAIAPRYTAGRYIEAAAGSTEPGRFWVNTYDLKSRPLYNLEALTLHEAVPGHHLQIALTREMDGLPPFRRHAYLTAFGEGWALYAEWLGLEAGFYTDPYSNFGRLNYEMWRACRLVVDTGLHAMGWSRERALEYLASHTALSRHEVQTEIDRYISWPGQALGYKMGDLEIRRLRDRAERALGSRFDVREFHDAVLRNGPVPLPVLAQSIDEYIAAKLRTGH